jgi:hypothetical protein
MLSFINWMFNGQPLPATPAGMGSLLGCIISTFGLGGVSGWIMAKLAWKYCGKSLLTAMAGFVLGAGGIFLLAALGNARIEHAQGEMVSPRGAPDIDHHFDVFDVIAMEGLISGTNKPTVTREWRDQLAQGYLTGTMPDKLIKLYETALCNGLLPDPRVGFKMERRLSWKGSPLQERWRRVGELLSLRNQRPPPPPGFLLDPPLRTAPSAPPVEGLAGRT